MSNHLIHNRHSSGFTLIEVMVGMVLTGILMTGLVGLWEMVGDQFFRSTLRQKAVFVLHGHMERIAMLYRKTDFFEATQNTVHNDLDKIIHQTTGSNLSNAYVSNLVVRETSNGNVEKYEDYFQQGQVLFMDQATEENIIWLDWDKNITAKIHWQMTSISDADTPCYSGDCYRLTLSLEYPFRFIPSTNPAAGGMWAQTETLTLQTIVGRR